MKGYGYEFLAILHAVTVIFTLLWLPFGKFFHIFQRPAQLGVEFYKDVGARGEPAHCRRCGHAFASQMHVEDLIDVERELGYPLRDRRSGGRALPVDLPALPARDARPGPGAAAGRRQSRRCGAAAPADAVYANPGLGRARSAPKTGEFPSLSTTSMTLRDGLRRRSPSTFGPHRRVRPDRASTPASCPTAS